MKDSQLGCLPGRTHSFIKNLWPGGVPGGTSKLLNKMTLLLSCKCQGLLLNQQIKDGAAMLRVATQPAIWGC
jgi:hypothetical protein